MSALRTALRASARVFGLDPDRITETPEQRIQREAQARLHAIVTATANSPKIRQYRINRAAGLRGWAKRREVQA